VAGRPNCGVKAPGPLPGDRRREPVRGGIDRESSGASPPIPPPPSGKGIRLTASPAVPGVLATAGERGARAGDSRGAPLSRRRSERQLDGLVGTAALYGPDGRDRRGRRRPAATSPGEGPGLLLIDRGADPFDPQALYNTSIVGDDVAWLDFLWAQSERRGRLAAWTAVPQTPEIGGAVPVNSLDYLLGNAVGFGRLARTEWLLAHGADPNSLATYTHIVSVERSAAICLERGNHRAISAVQQCVRRVTFFSSRMAVSAAATGRWLVTIR
jgi:hypothetical protein